MSGKRMPGRCWKGGVEGWEKDLARCIANARTSLSYSPEPTSDEVTLMRRDGSFARARFHMGLYEWWQGNEGEARGWFAEAATAYEVLLERWLPIHPDTFLTFPNFVEPTELGAMAASISGQPQLAHKLFAQAELLAIGARSSEEEAPKSHLHVLNHPNTIRPFVRAYHLIRLGRLSGFHSFIYTVPLEQARKATPVWMRTDIHHALDTANICYEIWRSERGGEDYLKKKKFEPLLRALVACLSPGAGEQERLTVRKALQAYQDSIHDLYYFFEIYPRVLDLRAAYPHLFA